MLTYRNHCQNKSKVFKEWTHTEDMMFVFRAMLNIRYTMAHEKQCNE